MEKNNKKRLISNPAYRISSYIPFTRNALQTLLSYRTNVLFFFLGNILRIFVFFFLWKAIFASSGSEILHNFTFPQMVMYLILTTSISELRGSVADDMSDEIGSGQIAMSLIKPISFRLRIYFTLIGRYDILFFYVRNSRTCRSIYEVLFIYGFAQIPMGLDHVFTDNLWLYAGWKIAKGEMDRLLTRPVNPLFQLIAERFQPDGLGEFLIGVILTVIAGIKLGLQFSFIKISAAACSVLFGAAIITGIKLFYTTFAFWVKRSQSYVYTAYNFNEFCYYPINIYNRSIQFLLTFIVPFAATSYYPAAFLLGKGTVIQGIIMPFVISAVFLGGAYIFWKTGLKHYESAGS